MCDVTIIVPTKNRVELLTETLASVAAQSADNFECLIVDDRSTDATAERVDALSRTDSRFRLLSVPEPRSGAQAARNVGIESAAGRYVILLDSDDLLAANCLQQRLAVMDDRPGLDFAVFPCECFNQTPGDVGLLWNRPTPNARGDNADADVDLDRFLRLDVPWQTTSPIWRASAIRRLLPWPEDVTVGQDWEFHIRALLAGINYIFAGDVDHYWRMPQADRDSIGKGTLRPQMLLDRVKTNTAVYHKVEAAGRMTEERRGMFAGMFFQSAERVGSRVSWREGLSVWRQAAEIGIIDKKQYRQGRNYFWLYRSKRLRSIYRNNLQRQWPAEFFAQRSATYLNTPCPSAPAEGAIPSPEAA